MIGTTYILHKVGVPFRGSLGLHTLRAAEKPNHGVSLYQGRRHPPKKNEGHLYPTNNARLESAINDTICMYSTGRRRRFNA